MRVLISGAIGRPLLRSLIANGHAVFALARTPQSAGAVGELGAEPVIADALDAAAVKTEIARIRPDAVINELTALLRRYTAAEMKAAAETDNRVRITGNANLLAALPDGGVSRYVLQSSGFWYAPGGGLADESESFAFDASPAVAAGARRYAELEAAAAATPQITLVVMRYGFFYGPGTWFSSDGDIGGQVRQRQVRLSVMAKVCGVGCTSMTLPRRRRPHSNAHPAPTTSSTATRRRRAAGSRPSPLQWARPHPSKSPSRKRSQRSAPMPSITRPRCAAPRTKRPAAS
jgi:nucleoside-diphosphate-sugar epimerase